MLCETDGADYFIKKNLDQLFAQSNNIDTVLLACTHYPLLKSRIEKFLPKGIQLLSQGEIVADSLSGYLHRHDEIEERCTKNGTVNFYTTDSAEDFDNHASIFYGKQVRSVHVDL